jgi:predicted Zn-dependent peptidase
MKDMRLRLTCVLCILAWAVHGGAQDARWQLGREPQVFVLENGLTVIMQTDAAAANSVVQLFVHGGSRDDPPAGAGLAFLTMRLALEIPDQTKLRELMDYGSSFSLHVGEDYSLITIRALSRHMQPTLDVLTDIFVEPLFSGPRIDGIKAQMGHLQKRAADEPNELMRTLTAANFFGASGYGAKLFGDEASLAALGKKDVQAFFNAHFAAANMVAAVVSDLDAAELKPMLARFLGRLSRGQKTTPAQLPPARAAQSETTVPRQAAQTHIAGAVLLPKLSAQSLPLATLLETWLGKGVGCRLWPLREQSDLTYGVQASVLPLAEAMLLNVYLKTGWQRADEAQRQLRHILTSVHENGISEAELTAAKAYARADFWRENESRERRAATLAFMEGMGLSHRLAGEFAARLQAVTADEMNRLIRDWLAPEKWFILRIGPK